MQFGMTMEETGLIIGVVRQSDPSLDSLKHPKVQVIIKQRKGRWVQEEEDYANFLSDEFGLGLARIDNGTTKRAYLSSKLQCTKMRISKKFKGKNTGKEVFLRKDKTPTGREYTPQDLLFYEQTHLELERRFLKAVLVSVINCGVKNAQKRKPKPMLQCPPAAPKPATSQSMQLPNASFSATTVDSPANGIVDSSLGNAFRAAQSAAGAQQTHMLPQNVHVMLSQTRNNHVTMDDTICGAQKACAQAPMMPQNVHMMVGNGQFNVATITNNHGGNQTDSGPVSCQNAQNFIGQQVHLNNAFGGAQTSMPPENAQKTFGQRQVIPQAPGSTAPMLPQNILLGNGHPHANMQLMQPSFSQFENSANAPMIANTSMSFPSSAGNQAQDTNATGFYGHPTAMATATPMCSNQVSNNMHAMNAPPPATVATINCPTSNATPSLRDDKPNNTAHQLTALAKPTLLCSNHVNPTLSGDTSAASSSYNFNPMALNMKAQGPGTSLQVNSHRIPDTLEANYQATALAMDNQSMTGSELCFRGQDNATAPTHDSKEDKKRQVSDLVGSVGYNLPLQTSAGGRKRLKPTSANATPCSFDQETTNSSSHAVSTSEPSSNDESETPPSSTNASTYSNFGIHAGNAPHSVHFAHDSDMPDLLSGFDKHVASMKQKPTTSTSDALGSRPIPENSHLFAGAGGIAESPYITSRSFDELHKFLGKGLSSDKLFTLDLNQSHQVNSKTIPGSSIGAAAPGHTGFNPPGGFMPQITVPVSAEARPIFGTVPHFDRSSPTSNSSDLTASD
jgi:hypothetical protein